MWPFRAKQAPSTRAEPVFVRYPEAPRVPQPAGMVRQFLGAKVEDLYADLPTAIRAANADIRPAIAILRARARHLEANNDYTAAYLMAGRRNVVGPQGIGLQMKVVQEKPDKKGNTQPDVMANRLIEQAWGRWCKPGVATVDGMSWRKAQLLAWTVLRRDGELLVPTSAAERAAAAAIAAACIGLCMLGAMALTGALTLNSSADGLLPGSPQAPPAPSAPASVEELSGLPQYDYNNADCAFGDASPALRAYSHGLAQTGRRSSMPSRAKEWSALRLLRARSHRAA